MDAVKPGGRPGRDADAHVGGSADGSIPDRLRLQQGGRLGAIQAGRDRGLPPGACIRTPGLLAARIRLAADLLGRASVYGGARSRISPYGAVGDDRKHRLGRRPSRSLSGARLQAVPQSGRRIRELTNHTILLSKPAIFLQKTPHSHRTMDMR